MKVYVIAFRADGYLAISEDDKNNVFMFYETAFKKLVELNTPLVTDGRDVTKFCEQMIEQDLPYDGYYGLFEVELNTELEGFKETYKFGITDVIHNESCYDIDWCSDIDDVLSHIQDCAEYMHEDEEEDYEEEEDK